MDAKNPCQRCIEAALGQDGKTALEERRLRRAGLADVSRELRSVEEVPHGGLGAWRTGGIEETGMARCVRYEFALEPGLFRIVSESPRQLRRGRDFRERQRQRYRPG